MVKKATQRVCTYVVSISTVEGQINQIWANQENVPLDRLKKEFAKFDMSLRLKAALSHVRTSIEKAFFCVCIIYKHKYHQSWAQINRK